MMDCLPQDVLNLVIKHAPVWDVLSLGRVCKRLAQACGDDCWHRLCLKYYFLMNIKPSLAQPYGGWKFVYFWKRKWYARYWRQSDSSLLSIVDARIQKIPATLTETIDPTNTQKPCDIREIKPRLHKELFPFILPYLEGNSEEWQATEDQLMKEPMQEESKADCEFFDSVLLNHKILFMHATGSSVHRFYVVRAMGRLLSDSLSERRLARWILLYNVPDYLLLTIGSTLRDMYPNPLERCVAVTFAAYVSRISPGFSEYYVASLQLTFHLPVMDLTESKTRIAGFAILSNFNNKEYLMQLKELIIKFLAPKFKIELAVVSFLFRAVKKFGEDMFCELIPEVIHVYDMAPLRSDCYYHGIPHPWLRVKVLQYLRAHSPQKLLHESEAIDCLLQELIMETGVYVDDLRHHDRSAINSMFSVFLEGVKLAKHLQRTEMYPSIENIIQQAKRSLPADAHAVRSLLHF